MLNDFFELLKAKGKAKIIRATDDEQYNHNHIYPSETLYSKSLLKDAFIKSFSNI